MKLVILVCVLCVSCNSLPGGCVKIGGSYRGVDGDIEYCYGAKESKELGTPVFVSPRGKLYGLDEADMEAIEKFMAPEKKAKMKRDKNGELNIKEILRRLRVENLRVFE